MPGLSRAPGPNPNTPARTVSDYRLYTQSMFHRVLLVLVERVSLVFYTKWAKLLRSCPIVKRESIFEELILERHGERRHGERVNSLAMASRVSNGRWERRKLSLKWLQ